MNESLDIRMKCSRSTPSSSPRFPPCWTLGTGGRTHTVLLEYFPTASTFLVPMHLVGT